MPFPLVRKQQKEILKGFLRLQMKNMLRWLQLNDLILDVK